MVNVRASMQRANTVDGKEGPGPVFARVAERFRPQAFYGNPTGREVFMVVDLDTPAKIAELMYILTWFTGGEPTFTAIMNPEIFGEAIANAKKIVAPPQQSVTVAAKSE
jgi:hypothetical protein